MMDDAHGQSRVPAAGEAFVLALEGQRQGSSEENAPLVAWSATHHLLALRGSVAELYAKHKAVLRRPPRPKPGQDRLACDGRPR